MSNQLTLMQECASLTHWHIKSKAFSGGSLKTLPFGLGVDYCFFFCHQSLVWSTVQSAMTEELIPNHDLHAEPLCDHAAKSVGLKSNLQFSPDVLTLRILSLTMKLPGKVCHPNL